MIFLVCYLTNLFIIFSTLEIFLDEEDLACTYNTTMLFDNQTVVYGEQIQQQELYETWVKDVTNAEKIRALKCGWFAFKDGHIIAQSDSYVACGCAHSAI